MATFNGTVNQIENNTLKVNEIKKENAEGTYPTTEAVKKFVKPIMNDYIVERGVAGMWTWEKWESGKAVCWGNQSLTVTIAEAWGNIVSSPSFNVAFPFEFMAIPVVTAQILYSSNNCFLGVASGYASNSVSGNYTLCRATPYEGVQCTVSWYVIGNWK